MKKNIFLPGLLFTFVLSILNVHCYGQKNKEPATLFSSEQVAGYGQFDMKYTQMINNDVILFGGEGGIIIDRHVLIGLSAHSTINEISLDKFIQNDSSYMHMGYGGLKFGYIIAPAKLFHLSIPLTFGMGKVDIYDKVSNEYDVESTKIETDNSFLLFAEPGLQVELNITRFFKINVGVAYRFNHNLKLENQLESTNLNNWTGNFSFVFGKF